MLQLGGRLINVWNNLSCELLLLGLKLFLYLCSAVEKTEIKEDKDLLCEE